MAIVQPPHSTQANSVRSSSPTTSRLQRDVRLQAALALIVGVALVAVPLFIWGRVSKKNQTPQPNMNTQPAGSSLMANEVPGSASILLTDAGANLAIDAGGRTVTVSEPRYIKCQNPGPSKTPADKCDHVGPIEEVLAKLVADQSYTCVRGLTGAQSVNFSVDVSFKKKKIKLKEAKEGSSMPKSVRKKAVACFQDQLSKMSSIEWDKIPHQHQRYAFEFLATFGASSP